MEAFPWLCLFGAAHARRRGRRGRQRQNVDGQGVGRGGHPARRSRSWPSTRKATSFSSSARPPSRRASPTEEQELRREFLDRVEPRVWTPGSSHGRRLSLDPIRLAGRDELARIAEPGRREEEWEGMLRRTPRRSSWLWPRSAARPTRSRRSCSSVLPSLAACSHGRDVDLGTIAAAASDPDDGRHWRIRAAHQEVRARRNSPAS